MFIKKIIRGKVFNFIKIFKPCFFLLFFIFPNFVLAHDHHDHNEKDIEKALQLFEKAYQLSPDLLPKQNPSSDSLRPYYNIGGEKVFLTQSSVLLMKEWVNIFAREIESHCENCHIDRETLLEEAVKNEFLVEETKDYAPENRMLEVAAHKAKHGAEDLSHLSVHYTAKYGKVIAGLIGIVEAFETVASFMMGLKGVHLICTPLQILIIPAGRKVQKYGRTLFYYGFNLSHSSLLLTSKMAWTTRTLHKRARNTFFYIDQTLQFNEEKLREVNAEGPRSLFHQKGHRLLWLERLKKKTDPLFTKIEEIEKELEQENLRERERKRLEKQVENTRNRIERLAKINRKEFFGNRFKRYLFLKSRKGRKAYMDGPELKSFNFVHKTIGSRNISWPLAPQFMIESTLEKEAHLKETLLGDAKLPRHKATDAVVSGLVEEFLSQRKITNNIKQSREAVHFFISDFHNIFDTTQKTSSRVMSAQAIEVLLTQFFAHYLKLAERQITHSGPISFRTKMRIFNKIGKAQNLSMQFTDFLTAVSVATSPNKVNFYKYESIEKFLSFLNYFDQIGQIMREQLPAEEALSRMEKAQKRVESFSLTRDKNYSINFIPFIKRKGKCYTMTGKR